MPRNREKEFKVIVDYSHGEILNLDDNEFHPFANLLNQLNCKTEFHNSGKIQKETLFNSDLLIIGCPINHYFLSDEINTILDFVINGGNLIVASEYGGDSVQKTNLNDLMKFFGIYFENTVIRTTGDTGSTSMPMITKVLDHEITKNIRKIMVGGTCSIRVAKEAQGVFLSGQDTWLEIYDDLNNKWIKNQENGVPLVAASTYGQGRVVAFGDIDIFSSSTRYGLCSLDNRRFIRNIFSWISRPVRSEITMDWMLGQISTHREELFELKDNFSNLIETVKILEKRISGLEESERAIQEQLLKHIESHNQELREIRNEQLRQRLSKNIYLFDEEQVDKDMAQDRSTQESNNQEKFEDELDQKQTFMNYQNNEYDDNFNDPKYEEEKENDEYKEKSSSEDYDIYY